jgi:hypothetical protein
MSEGIRNLAIAIAVLVAVAVYACISWQHYSFNKQYRSTAISCARKNNNFMNKDAYATCMIYNGYDENANFNYNQNHDY